MHYAVDTLCSQLQHRMCNIYMYVCVPSFIRLYLARYHADTIKLTYLPGAAAPSETLDPDRGLCRMKSMKKPILLRRNFTKWFLNKFKYNACFPFYIHAYYNSHKFQIMFAFQLTNYNSRVTLSICVYLWCIYVNT